MISETESESSVATATPSETLFADLLEGMHAAAQPLSILHATLSREYAESMDREELWELTLSSADQVERLRILFNYMQQLVATESTKALLLPERLPPLLNHVLEGVDLLFDEAGIYLSVAVPDDCPEVLIDSMRMENVLTSMLLYLHSASAASDTVALTASWTDTVVRLELGNEKLQIARLDAKGRLGMALAKANLLSQGGRFSYSLKPFQIQIELETVPLLH